MTNFKIQKFLSIQIKFLGKFSPLEYGEWWMNEMKPIQSQIICQHSFSYNKWQTPKLERSSIHSDKVQTRVLPSQTINIDHTPEFWPIIDLLNSAGKAYLGTLSEEAVQWYWYQKAMWARNVNRNFYYLPFYYQYQCHQTAP